MTPLARSANSGHRPALASLVEAVLKNGSRAVAITAVTAVAALGLTTGLAQAKAAPRAGGVVHFYEASTSTGNTATDVITGAISDYGNDHQSANGNTAKIVLKKGSFEANLTKLDAKIHPITQDLSDCSVVLAGTAPIALSHGTGAYKGIHGSLTVHVINAIVFKVKKGAKCSPGPTAPELTAVEQVTGSGRVSL
jgi:hypothetical protein